MQTNTAAAKKEKENEHLRYESGEIHTQVIAIIDHYAMLCYAMLCYAMLCYTMLCDAMLMLCYAML